MWASRLACLEDEVEDDDAELFVAAICPGQLRTAVIGGELEARVRCPFSRGKRERETPRGESRAGGREKVERGVRLIHPEAAAGGEGVDAREGDASMARVATGDARKTTQETFVQSPL